MTTFLTPPCITAYILCHTPAGARYLLLRRCCGGYLNGTWQMVTGGTAEGETAIQTALREIEEETGLTPEEFYTADMVETFFLHGVNKMVSVPVFVAVVSRMDVRLCPEEHDLYEWLPFDEAVKRLVWNEQKRIITQIDERFVKNSPHPLLKIDRVPTAAPATLSRTGVYGVAKQGGKLLLVKQYKGPHKGKWDLPGGRIEMGETVEDALHREFREEVAMRFDSMHLLANTSATTEVPNLLFHQIGMIYEIDGLATLPGAKPEMEWAWIDPSAVTSDLLSPFAKWILHS